VKVVLLENVRFNKGEKKKLPTSWRSQYAALCDVFSLMDAFAPRTAPSGFDPWRAPVCQGACAPTAVLDGRGLEALASQGLCCSARAAETQPSWHHDPSLYQVGCT